MCGGIFARVIGVYMGWSSSPFTWGFFFFFFFFLGESCFSGVHLWAIRYFELAWLI